MKKKSTLKRVLAYVLRYPVSVVGSLLFSLIGVGAALFGPVFFGDAIDCIIENGVLWAQLRWIFIKA